MAKDPAGTRGGNSATDNPAAEPLTGSTQRRTAPSGGRRADERAPAPSAEPTSAKPQSNAAPPPVTRTMPNPIPGDGDIHVRRRRIAEAAYYRAEQRGFAPGSEHEDWLAAEKQVDRGTPTDKKPEDNEFPSPK